MKIAITGTHSTGKTTLAESISSSYGIPYIRGDKAIQICESKFPNTPINKLNTKEQWELQQLMFQSFNEALDMNGDCVTDGFHLTCIPYGIKYTNGEITQMPGYGSFVQRVLEQSHKFDAVFYLPPEIALENDNFRPLDQALRMDIDNSMYALLHDYDFRTLSGTVNARTQKAGEEIGKRDSMWDRYIVFEGLPRSGKTTQIRRLKERSESKGVDLYVTERNNNEYMEEFKHRKSFNPYDSSREMLRLHSEALKYDFEINNITERLADGQIVVSDRQKFTTMTLFGALGVPRHQVYEAVYDLPDPGKTIYLDTNPVISVARAIQTEPGKVLKSDLKLQGKVRNLYKEYAKSHRFHVIPANQGEDVVANQISEIIFGK